MPIVTLESLDDSRLEPYLNLKTCNATRWNGRFVAEGIKLVERLIASEFPVDSVLVGDSYLDKIRPSLRDEIPVYVVPTRQIDELVGFGFHRGILACGRRRPQPDLADWLRSRSGRLTLSVCAEVSDPENLGAIVRISAAFGVDAVLVGGGSTDPFSRRVLRVSMGTTFHLPIYESSDLAADLAVLQAADVELAATVLDPRAESLEEATRGHRLALLFGNEGYGLPDTITAICNRRITIPMHGGTDSLNVSVAAGIFLYHFTRRLS